MSKSNQPRLCEVIVDGEQCGRKHKAHGMCAPHYKRSLKGLPLDVPIVDREQHGPRTKQCSVPDCPWPARRYGFCNTHSNRYRKYGDPMVDIPIRVKGTEKTICSMDECPYVVKAHGWCHKHYDRWLNHGDPLWTPPVKMRPASPGHKWCLTCNLELPVIEFTNSNKNSDGLSSRCGECTWKWYITRQYNITVEWYQKQLIQQGGVCAICKRPETRVDSSGRIHRLSVDHDHACCADQKSCGKCVRGLICSNCNHALGNVYDDVETLLAMVDYLTFHHDRREQYARSDVQTHSAAGV